MKFYQRYNVLILILALILNWVVAGNNDMGKVDMNLGLLPKFSVIIIEVLQALILIRILVLYPKINFITATTALVVAFCVFELGVIYAMGAKIATWISGIRYYFSFLPLVLVNYLIAYKGLSLKKEFKWLLLLIFLQIPVSVYQFMNLSSVKIINDRQLLYDMISGTMGGFASNLMSLVIGIGLLYYLIKYFEKQQFKYLLMALILLVPPIIAEAKGMLILLLIILAYLAYIFKFNLSRILMLGVIAAVMVVGFSYIYLMLGYGNSMSASYLIEYANSESGSGRLSRIDSMIHSFSLLLQNDTLIFGMGIGNANKSPLGQDGQFYDFFTIRHSIDILIAETGLLGLLFMATILGTLIRMASRLLKTEEVKQNEEYQLIIRVFLGSIFIFLFGLFWVDVLFRLQFMYPFGMMAGYAVGLHQKIKHDKKIEKAAYYQLQT